MTTTQHTLAIVDLWAEMKVHHDRRSFPPVSGTVLRLLDALEERPAGATAVELADRLHCRPSEVQRALDAIPGLIAHYAPTAQIRLDRVKMATRKPGAPPYRYRIETRSRKQNHGA